VKEIFSALNLTQQINFSGEERLPSFFAVTELASCAIGAVGQALAELLLTAGHYNRLPEVQVDRRLASLWFAQSIAPIDWQLPPVWDDIAGDYQTADGWIKLHTNLPHHRKAALSVIDARPTRQAVASRLLGLNKDELELAIVNAGGVAAAMRSRDEWEIHPQGRAVASEPLIHWNTSRTGEIRPLKCTKERPLQGLKVLDLTRVLAGPVATRTLAGFGAQVLRIDPPEWNEANVVADITLGKRCSYLNLKEPGGRHLFETLLTEADVLIHGYRPDALEKIGYGETERLNIAPQLIDISLNAYGWTGPWSQRRGFDSLVQMSSGIAEQGMRWRQHTRPSPLPVQALDHATGYMMAAATLIAINRALSEGCISSAKVSLAKTAHLLLQYPQREIGELSTHAEKHDYSAQIESTPWGEARRLKAPLNVVGTQMYWQLPACKLGSAPPQWLDQ
jgi:hypothetical protein